jgi:putative endonuclease
MYYVYILTCADGTLYTGYTNNLARRLREHNYSRTKGARYTRARRPVHVSHFEKFSTRSGALKREWEIKSLGRSHKLLLMRNSARIKKAFSFARFRFGGDAKNAKKV